MATTRRYSFGEYTLDIDRGALLRAGADVALRPKSYAVLWYLVEHHGHLVTKQELLDAIWGHVVVTEGTLTHCLVDIRRALADESQHMLRTVRGRSYLFDVPVEGLDGGDNDSVAMPPQLRPAPELRRAGRLLLPLSAILAAAVFWWIAVTGTGRSTIAEAPQQVTAARSIAVLPFLDLSPEQDQEYFSDGISEEILNRLSSFRELHVIARTSSFAFKDSGHDIPRLTSLLGVRYVLQGSVRKDGSTLRISAQLVDSSGRHLWSETFDRDISVIFATQTEIAEEVALRIFPQLSPRSRTPACGG